MLASGEQHRIHLPSDMSPPEARTTSSDAILSQTPPVPTHLPHFHSLTALTSIAHHNFLQSKAC